MVHSLTKILFDTDGSDTIGTPGDAQNFQRLRDDIGTFVVKIVGGSGVSVQLQGRAHPLFEWEVLDSIDETDVDGNGMASRRVGLRPEMRVDVPSGTATTIVAGVLE